MQTDHTEQQSAVKPGAKNGDTSLNKALTTGNRLLDKIMSYPSISHLMRAVDRFNDRLGSQFGAAITYFSFLSIIPILMISFAAAGFVLASQPELMQVITDNIINVINEPTLAATLEQTVNTAVQQRTSVGLTGLLLALYSGISWMGNFREAIRAQSRDVWERNQQEKDNIFKRYGKDLLRLFGLVLALILTIVLTSIAGSAQTMLINALGLNSVPWLKTPLTFVTLFISIGANYLMFLWIFWIMPNHKPLKSALFRGSLIAAIGFEVIKYVMTITVPNLIRSPSGAAFGSIIALLAFFYFFARLTLFCAAWIATAENPADKSTENASAK
jgi:membrane protein